jgi:acyl-CoA synthetase (AMP-forming)/AMP-acid ligase II
MSYALKIAQTKFLLTLPASMKVALAAAEQVGIPRKHIFLLEGSVEGFRSIQQLMEVGARYAPDPPYRIPQGQTNKDICGYLNFSSGTTGLPKAVCRIRPPRRKAADGEKNRSCSRTRTSSLSVTSFDNSRRLDRTRFWP